LVGENGRLRFNPASVNIQIGDTVEWVWSAGRHSTTSGTPGAPNGIWDSGVTNHVGFTFSHTFSDAGSFPYFCTPHGACCGMTGNVTVSMPTPTPTPPLPLIKKGAIKLTFSTVASGLTAPLEVTSAADGSGRLFIVQQTGQIRILKNGNLLATPFLNVAGRMVNLMPDYDERGLLGFAFHPDFNNPSAPGFHKIYTYTCEPVTGPADFTVPNPSSFDSQSVIAEWKVSATNANVIAPASRREIMRIDEPQFNHKGGQLAFRPSDHYLYISLGDGGNANDVGDGHNPTKGNGQTKSTVLGKVLRIDPLDPALTTGSSDPISANGKYRIPRTNPFVFQANSVGEIFVWGLRNPFRFGFDANSDRLIIGDVGQNNIEEIDIGVSGKNYGWNRKEGTFLFNHTDGTIRIDPNPNPNFTNPVAEYSHFDGIAVIGGYIYRGTKLPLLAGKYIFGDLFGPGPGSGRLFFTTLQTGVIREFQYQQNPLAGSFLKGIGRDDTGELYFLIDSNIGPSGTGGKVLKIVQATQP
jgi:glucose/arabinose dehydrogenase